MLNFSTKPYSFQINDDPYTLPVFTTDEFEEMKTSVYSRDSEDQPAALRDLVLKHATDKRTKDALRKIRMTDLGELFRDWSGIGKVVEPGESPTSTN